MKAVKDIIMSRESIRKGNYKVDIHSGSRDFTYYDTIVCRSFDNIEKCVLLVDAYKSISTTRVLNSFREEFERRGYEVLEAKKEA